MEYDHLNAIQGLVQWHTFALNDRVHCLNSNTSVQVARNKNYDVDDGQSTKVWSKSESSTELKKGKGSTTQGKAERLDKYEIELMHE